MKSAIELVKARKDVNSKVRSLQSDIAESEIQLEKYYEPITKPFKQFISTVHPKIEPKLEAKAEQQTPKRYGRKHPKDEWDDLTVTPPPPDIYEATPEVDLSGDDSSIDQSRLLHSTLRGVSEAGLAEYLEQYTGLAKEFIGTMLEDKSSVDHDHQYGIRWHPENETFTIGNAQVDFKSDDKIVVGGKEYQGTRGLFELLFKKEPHNYSRLDERNYKDIVLSSSAHRMKYDPTARILGNAGRKYLGIIQPMLSDAHGSGMQTLKLTNKRLEFVPWNNPNKLANRLRVLLASQSAGHTGHENEIIYLIDELRSAHYIE